MISHGLKCTKKNYSKLIKSLFKIYNFSYRKLKSKTIFLLENDMAENTLDDLINDLQNININKGKITTSQKKFPTLSYGENIVKLETGTIFKRKPKYILLDERINEIVKTC
ncbi:hypothetical protein BpHYR1_037972 [Brachionus plicatilis]|uniref:Uncharacterized protein n=1 Tax=Brachionus plicatilis TaxID=10195 RepID=A0A3M7QN65_BRAPC|nr:hypothetical protein BpHYR1_037972 [Brachionus plicatilis]